jgi:hypothetical protein
MPPLGIWEAFEPMHGAVKCPPSCEKCIRTWVKLVHAKSNLTDDRRFLDRAPDLFGLGAIKLLSCDLVGRVCGTNGRHKPIASKPVRVGRVSLPQAVVGR